MSESIDRLSPRRQPEGPHQGEQRWHRLLFSHWEVPAAALAPLIHPALSVDTFEGRAYVGAVAFTMQNVRPWRGLPKVPLANEFFEINLRTYVHHAGAEPGVWFFSLDANNLPAAWAARTFWNLPYWHAQIEGADDGQRGTWQLVRTRPKPAQFTARYEIGDDAGFATEGTLEFWLTERYRMYCRRGEKLLRGEVHHTPYPLRRATAECSGGLLEALGLSSTGARTPDFFSPGVDARLWKLQEVVTGGSCRSPSPGLRPPSP